MNNESFTMPELLDTRPVSVLALNPAVDISYDIPELLADQKVRASRTLYHPGGNGINVARGLVELGIPVRCCSVLGGESGQLFLRLLGDELREGLRHIHVPGETRINVTLQQKQPPGQYEVDSGGPELSSAVLDHVVECFLEHVGDGYGVLTGSTPPGVPESIYADLIERIRSQNGKVILDTHGELLALALEAKPLMVRINRYVLEHTRKRRLTSIEAIAEAARDIQRAGAGYVCISIGKEGAIILDDHQSYHCTAPRVRVASTVGSGDSTVAGLISGLLRRQSLAEILRFGVICGSATASHPGTGLFTREEIEEKAYEVQISALDI